MYLNSAYARTHESLIIEAVEISESMYERLGAFTLDAATL